MTGSIVIDRQFDASFKSPSLASIWKIRQYHDSSKLPIQIFDDSNNEKIEEEFESICLEFKKELNITFFNKAWQKQFIKMLKNEFSKDTDIIDWLLTKNNNLYSGGRVWNFALLNNAGKKFLFFDDI